MDYLNVIFILLALIVFNFLYNLFYFFSFKRVEQLYLGALTDDAKLITKAKTNRNVILNYIKYSGIKDHFFPAVQRLGLGQISTGNVSVFDNILMNRSDIVPLVVEMLLEAKGNYKSKCINSFNPIYWIRIILNLPKIILTYLGVPSKSVFIRIFQLIYWALAVTCTFILAVFPNEINEFIKTLFNIS